MKKIREFCPIEVQDRTCPEPALPKSINRAGVPLAPDEMEVSLPPRRKTVSRPMGIAGDDGSSLPLTKKSRVCSTCKNKGHNSRTCTSQQ